MFHHERVEIVTKTRRVYILFISVIIIRTKARLRSKAAVGTVINSTTHVSVSFFFFCKIIIFSKDFDSFRGRRKIKIHYPDLWIAFSVITDNI